MKINLIIPDDLVIEITDSMDYNGRAKREEDQKITETREEFLERQLIEYLQRIASTEIQRKAEVEVKSNVKTELAITSEK